MEDSKNTIRLSFRNEKIPKSAWLGCLIQTSRVCSISTLTFPSNISKAIIYNFARNNRVDRSYSIAKASCALADDPFLAPYHSPTAVVPPCRRVRLLLSFKCVCELVSLHESFPFRPSVSIPLSLRLSLGSCFFRILSTTELMKMTIPSI